VPASGTRARPRVSHRVRSDRPGQSLTAQASSCIHQPPGTISRYASVCRASSGACPGPIATRPDPRSHDQGRAGPRRHHVRRVRSYTRTRPTSTRLRRPSRRSPARRPSPWIPRRTMPTCSSPSEVRLHRQRWCAAGAGGRTRPWSAGSDRRRLVHRHQVMSVGRQKVASFTEPQDGWRAVFPTVNLSAPS